MKWEFYGPAAILLQFAEGMNDEAFEKGRALCRFLEEEKPEAVLDYTLTFNKVLLQLDPYHRNQTTIKQLVRALEKTSKKTLPKTKIKEVPVVYDGPDLEPLAKSKKLDIQKIIQLHTQPVYKVYFLGFSPGFAYMGELDPQLYAMRLKSPRLRVPSGSVAIGGRHTSVYPSEINGGWNLIGHTPLPIFSPQAANVEQMFFFRQGDRVKFVPSA